MKYTINDKNKYHWRINYKRHESAQLGYSIIGKITPKEAVGYLNRMRDTYQFSDICLMAYDVEIDSYFILADYVKLPDLREWSENYGESVNA